MKTKIVLGITLSLWLWVLIVPQTLVELIMLLFSGCIFLVPLGGFATSFILFRFGKRKFTEWVFLLSAGCALFFMIALPYWRNGVYLEKMQQILVQEDQQDLRTRFMPYEIAETTLRQNMGDSSGTTLSNVTYIDDQEGQRWTAIADGNGPFIKIKRILAYKQDGTTESCDVSQMHYPALKGTLGNNVKRYTTIRAPWSNVDIRDIYGDCVKGTARLYVPFRKVQLPLGNWVPAGVLIIENGVGKVYYAYTLEMRGPVYPESIFRAQQEALNYSKGWLERVFNGFGYQETKGPNNPNKGNTGQYHLTSVFGGRYVTPMTSRGDAGAIIIEVSTRTDVFKAGKINPMQVVTYPTGHAGTEDMESSLRTRYPSLEWASGLKVLEIVPGGQGNYVGYLGYATDVSYIAYFKPDGNIQIEDVAATRTTQGNNPEPTTKNTACEQAWEEVEKAVETRNTTETLNALGIVSQHCK